MSSGDLYESMSASDVGLLRDVLESAGFQYQDPMAGRDRDAARFLITQYQNGKGSVADLRALLRKHALLTEVWHAPLHEVQE